MTNFKDFLGENKSLNYEDKKLIASILVNDKNKAFELIENSDDKFFEISCKEKIVLEIEKGIKEEVIKYNDKKIYGTKVMQKRQTRICRTITLLVTLKLLFECENFIDDDENEMLIDKFDAILAVINNKDIKNKIKNFLYKDNDFYYKTGSLKISFQLFIIKILKLSQIEWEKNEYCFEKMSAKRVKKIFESLFKKISEEKDYSQLLIIIENLLRWQTLPGQLYRQTANINIKEKIKDNIKKENIELFLTMLSIIGICDNILKANSSYYEIKIKQTLQKTSVNTSVDTFIKMIKDEIKKDKEKGFINYKIDYKKKSSKYLCIEKDMILSYVGFKYVETISELLKKTPRIEGKINHVIYYKQQRNYDLFNETNEIKKEELSLSGDENIWLLYLNPDYIIQKYFKNIYGINKRSKNDLMEPYEYIETIFKTFTEKKKSDNKSLPLPLPFVKIVTDNLSVYKELANYNDKVFPARITIDGELFEEIWLLDEKNLDKSKNVEIILGRLLNCIINNYGMARQYKTVDIDFSASKLFSVSDPKLQSPKDHPWYKIMEGITTDYGFHVFERYLKNTLNKRIEYTTNEERYFKHIKKYERKIFENYSFWKDKKAKNRLTREKNIMLSLDIGGIGIECQFFELSKKSQKSSIKLSKTLYLNNLDSSFYIPTQADKTQTKYIIEDVDSKELKFRNIEAFAAYVKDKLEELLEIKDKKEYLTKLLCIGFCWPGPLNQNRIAGTSSTLKKISGITGYIMKDTHDTIQKIDVVKAFKEVFNVETVSMVNDGDAELIGLAYGMNDTLNNKMIVILKGGTGLGGALLYQGKLYGLNEFGKIIYDLNADNSPNENKKLADKWPQGDANKLFSQQLFKLTAEEVGLNKDIITGYDISILLKFIDKNGKLKEIDVENKKLFGAIELIKHIAMPYIEYSEIVEYNHKILENKSVLYKNNRYIVTNGTITVDKDTLRQMSSDGKLEDFTLFEMLGNNQLNFEKFLEILGGQRIHRLNISKDNDYKKIRNLSNKLGQGAAELTTLLYNIYHFDVVVMCGGIVKAIDENEFCKKYEETIKAYLKDRYYKENNIINWQLDKKNQKRKFKEIFYDDEVKLQYVIEKSNNGLLGCAIGGLDKFIQEQKLSELRIISKEVSTAKGSFEISNEVNFLTYEECKEFLEENAADMNIMLELQEDIKKIIIEKM